MATITIPKKPKKIQAPPKGRMVRVTEWSHEYLWSLSERSGRSMADVLELVLRQVNVRSGTKEARP